jgi:hypothetical protein
MGNGLLGGSAVRFSVEDAAAWGISNAPAPAVADIRRKFLLLTGLFSMIENFIDE